MEKIAVCNSRVNFQIQRGWKMFGKCRESFIESFLEESYNKAAENLSRSNFNESFDFNSNIGIQVFLNSRRFAREIQQKIMCFPRCTSRLGYFSFIFSKFLRTGLNGSRWIGSNNDPRSTIIFSSELNSGYEMWIIICYTWIEWKLSPCVTWTDNNKEIFHHLLIQHLEHREEAY